MTSCSCCGFVAGCAMNPRAQGLLRQSRRTRGNMIAARNVRSGGVFPSNVFHVRLFHSEKQERRMSNSAIRLSVLAMFSMALLAAPAPRPAFAAGGDNPAPPASDSNTKSSKDKKKKSSENRPVDDPAFLKGYSAAYATIYDRHDYAGAIAQLKALGHEERADVANLIGYSYRKLGDYQVSQ